MAGRRPKPTSLKLLQGNPGRRPINKDEPKPELLTPSAPKTLKGRALREWKRLVPELEGLGLLTRIDRAALVAYCLSYARFIEAELTLQKDGMFVTRGEGLVKHPALGVSQEERKAMKSFLVEFGMTPASRTKISTKPHGETEAKKKAKRHFG